MAKPKAKVKKTPAFFALSAKLNTVRGGQIFRFEKVKLNTGGTAIPYNPKTGIFTATRKGLYYFSALILGYRRNAVHYQLNKNKEVYLLGYSHRGKGADASTISAIMELKVGDKVFVKHRGRSREYFHAHGHSTYAGHFIGD